MNKFFPILKVYFKHDIKRFILTFDSSLFLLKLTAYFYGVTTFFMIILNQIII